MKKCDHILGVGYDSVMNTDLPFYKSEIERLKTNDPGIIEELYIRSNVDRFRYCPICGEKISEVCDYD